MPANRKAPHKAAISTSFSAKYARRFPRPASTFFANPVSKSDEASSAASTATISPRKPTMNVLP